MPSPFPGMDPYIERPAIWPDFHDALITFIRGALQPLIKPRYVALGRDRLYLVESERPVFPDVSIVESGRNRPIGPAGQTAANAVVADPPLVFQFTREEVREPYIEIIEPAAGNRVVTAIEVLSPDNKTAGEGRNSYLRKRQEYLNAGAHCVEIDLLHEVERKLTSTPANGNGAKQALELAKRGGAARYAVTVWRQSPAQREVYPIPLQHRLPEVLIPLANADPDVVLDLQAAFTRSWDEGPYPELLHYDGPPPGDWSDADVSWCGELLRNAGFRS